LLPAEGTILTLRIVRKLREDLSFSEQELTDLNLKQEDGRVTWEQKNAVGKDVTLGPKATELIVKALTDLSESGKASAQHLALFDTFMPDTGQE
jgi:hypothetical protein